MSGSGERRGFQNSYQQRSSMTHLYEIRKRLSTSKRALTPIFIKFLLDVVGNLSLLLEKVESLHDDLQYGSLITHYGVEGLDTLNDDLRAWRPPGPFPPYRRRECEASPLLLFFEIDY